MRPATRLLPWIAGFVILFGAVAGLQTWHDRHEAKAARAAAEQKLDRFRPGDCLTAHAERGGQGAADLLPADCASGALTLTVGLKVVGADNCPTGPYFAYQVSIGPQQVGALCLVENLREGHCYTESAAPPLHEEVACSTTMAEASSAKDARVVKVVEGSNDPSVCADSSPLVYPEPRRVYCMGSPIS